MEVEYGTKYECCEVVPRGLGKSAEHQGRALQRVALDPNLVGDYSSLHLTMLQHLVVSRETTSCYIVEVVFKTVGLLSPSGGRRMELGCHYTVLSCLESKLAVLNTFQKMSHEPKKPRLTFLAGQKDMDPI